jgi:hypothetical protein
VTSSGFDIRTLSATDPKLLSAVLSLVQMADRAKVYIKLASHTRIKLLAEVERQIEQCQNANSEDKPFSVTAFGRLWDIRSMVLSVQA